MDNNHLNHDAGAEPLPGLKPLVQHAVLDALKHHTAAVTAAALAVTSPIKTSRH